MRLHEITLTETTSDDIAIHSIADEIVFNRLFPVEFNNLVGFDNIQSTLIKMKSRIVSTIGEMVDKNLISRLVSNYDSTIKHQIETLISDCQVGIRARKNDIHGLGIFQATKNLINLNLCGNLYSLTNRYSGDFLNKSPDQITMEDFKESVSSTLSHEIRHLLDHAIAVYTVKNFPKRLTSKNHPILKPFDQVNDPDEKYTKMQTEINARTVQAQKYVIKKIKEYKSNPESQSKEYKPYLISVIKDAIERYDLSDMVDEKDSKKAINRIYKAAQTMEIE